MKLHFKRVFIDNFLSIGHAELELENQGYVLINGINNCPVDNAASNGSGKSSLLNAIFFALTGETAQGISKNLVNIHTEGGTRVELDFAVDGTDYKICRHKDHKKFKNDLQIFVNGEDKSGKGLRDSERILSEYLPELTSSLLGSVIILGQGMPQRFANNTPAGRKEILERLSKSDFMIEDIKSRLADRRTSLLEKIRQLEDALLTSNSQLSVYNKQLLNYQDQLSNLKSSAELILRVNEIKDKLTVLRANIESISANIQIQRDKLNELSNKQSLASYEYNAQVQDVRNKYAEKKNEYKQLIYELNAKISSLSSEINKLKSISDICPTCGQKLPNVHKVDTTEKERELAQLQINADEVRDNLNSVDAREQSEIVEIKSSYESQQLSSLQDIENYKRDLFNLTQSLSNYENEERSQSTILSKLENTYQGLEQNRQTLLQNIKNVEEEIAKLNSNTLYITTDRDEARSRLDLVSKMLTIVSRDFRGFLLTNVIDYLNRRCKSYCLDIFNTDRFELSQDGNNLNISYDDKLYENLSGGEQRKLDIITQFSIADMLRQFSTYSSNLLILDEVFDGVDVDGCGKIIDVITKRLTDVESIFIVTHRANLMIPADSTITVVKNENGVSSIQ